MPAQRQRAAFEPLSPDLDVPNLIRSTPNFEEVVRIHCDAIDENGLENFEKLVLLHVIVRGLPLVVEGFEKKLDRAIFSENWLNNHYSAKREHGSPFAPTPSLTSTCANKNIEYRRGRPRPDSEKECTAHNWALP